MTSNGPTLPSKSTPTLNPRWQYFAFHNTKHLFQNPPPITLSTTVPSTSSSAYKKTNRGFEQYDATRYAKRPIVIDNGSYTCKVGWAGDKDPTMIFAPLVGKQRGGLGSRKCLVGSDLQPEDFARLNVRSPFDGEVVQNLELQERVLDYIFSNMHIDTDRINHPVLMTECVANPMSCRNSVTELLFECYRVPSVCYGVDALFSYHHHQSTVNAPIANVKDGLIVRSGFHGTHILPLVNGRFDAEKSIRLSMGGYEVTDFAMRTMQFKYPHHAKQVTLDKAEEFKEEHTYVSPNYGEELQRFATDPDYFDAQTHVALLPYETSIVRTREKTTEELEKQAQKRKVMSERMKQMAKTRNVEQKKEQEQQLQDLIDLKEMKTSNPALYARYRKEYGYENDEEIEETVKYLQKKLKNAEKRRQKKEAEEKRKKEMENDSESPPAASDVTPAKTSTDTPTAEGNVSSDSKAPAGLPASAGEVLSTKSPNDSNTTQQDQTTEPNPQTESKKKSVTGKKRKKKDNQTEPALDTLFDENLKESRPETYLRRLKAERLNVIRRIGVLKQMRVKAEATSSKSRRRTGASNKKLKAMAIALGDENDDTFGMEDEDWDLYASINDAGIQARMDLDGMKESESRDEKLLKQIDEQIIAMEHELYGSASLLPHQREPTHYIDQFKYSLSKSPTMGTFKDEQEEYDYHQMRFAVERMRVPEVIFQPSMIGMEEAGLAELLDLVLKRYSHNSTLQDTLSRNIYVCGGNSMFPQLADRLRNELRMLRPVGSEINIACQRDPLDAWRGASRFASDNTLFSNASITRKLYEECGTDYLMEHCYSNVNIFDKLKNF